MAADVHSRTRSQVSPRTVWTVGFNVAGLLFVGWLASETRAVLAWVFVSLFVALAFSAPVRFLERWLRLPRWAAVLVPVVLVLGMFAVLFGTFVPLLFEQGKRLVTDAPRLLEQLRHLGPVEWLEARFSVMARLQEAAERRSTAMAGSAMGLLAGVAHGLAGVVTVTILAVFMLLFGRDVFERSLLWIHPERRPHFRHLVERMSRKVGGYVSGTLLIASIGAGVTAVTLVLLGVPYFLPLGLSMLVLGIIPFVGPFLGGVLVVGVTFATSGVRAGVISLVVFLLYQQVENHLLNPLIQRRTIHMNPLIIALVMLFGTAFAGILGALLALPIAGAVQVVLQDGLRRRHLRWAKEERAAAQLSFRALTPPEQTPATPEGEARH